MLSGIMLKMNEGKYRVTHYARDKNDMDASGMAQPAPPPPHSKNDKF